MMKQNAPMRGYSLLELIVALGLFSMVMLIVIGVYLALISYDRQARATNQLVANLSFSVESMVRSIRTGTQYTCYGASPCSTFTFRDSANDVIGYCLRADGTLGRRSGGALGGNDCRTSSQTVVLTDPSIDVETLSFTVRGTTNTDSIQPQVMIVISGTVGTNAGQETDFTIQTSATQRLLDIP